LDGDKDAHRLSAFGRRRIGWRETRRDRAQLRGGAAESDA
jgi:hypothetical protein